jgi:hypothetical protein
MGRRLVLLWLCFVFILSVPHVRADFLTPPEEAPAFQLSNIRRESDNFGRPVVAIDYQRTKNGKGGASLSGRTKTGIVSFGLSIPSEDRGTLRLASMFSLGDVLGEMEFFIVANRTWAEDTSVTFLLSNPVSLANVGNPITARPWNDKEKAAHAKHLLGLKPPETIPPKYESIDATTRLVPGLPVAAAYYGEWVEAEVIEYSQPGRIVVKLLEKDRIRRLQDHQWVVVEASILQRMRTTPNEFKASVRILANSLLAIPADAVPLEGSVKLVPGTPLLLDENNQWMDVFMVEDQSDKLLIHYKGWESKWDRSFPRSKLVVRQDVLTKLGQPDAAPKFASNLSIAEAKNSFEDGKGSVGAGKPGKKRLQNYPINSKLLRGTEIVPADIFLPAGTKLAACWGTKWYIVSVIEDNQDGTIAIRWKDFPSEAWDCSLRRDQLIVETVTLKKLRATAAKAKPVSNDQFRTWKDASGKFSVEANYLRREEGDVFLTTKDGKELRVPISKLSKGDQEFLETIVESEPDNPFAR